MQVVVGLGLMFGNGAASYLSKTFKGEEIGKLQVTPVLLIYTAVFVIAQLLLSETAIFFKNLF